MDPHTLPDDPHDWPTDPFALLGVPRSVGEADLKRAYTRLIRKYKPEHAPDEFRRIREAYESAVEMSRWYRDAPPVRDAFHDLPFTAPPEAAPPDPSAPQPDAPSGPAPEPAHEPQIDPPVRPVSVDPVEAAWGDAVAGRWGDAYAVLVGLAAQDLDRADLALRLYWLLALRPTLDDGRTRHDWLAAALARGRLMGPAVELYRRELAADPPTALADPYAHLLEVQGASGRALLTVATARLAAADGRWAVIESDLAALEHRAAELDDAAWLDYLTDLAARATGDQPPLLERCRTLLDGLRHLELSHGWAFDRLEHRQLMRTHLGLFHIPDPIRRAVLADEAGDDDTALAAAVAWAAADPCAALLACDVGMVSPQGRECLVTFERFLTDRAGRPSEYPGDLVRAQVRAHLARTPAPDYERARGPLFLFLLAERIDPDELVGACFADPHSTMRDLVRHVRDDAALRLVYRLVVANV
jgi:hypothetical protein